MMLDTSGEGAVAAGCKLVVDFNGTLLYFFVDSTALVSHFFQQR